MSAVDLNARRSGRKAMLPSGASRLQVFRSQ
jgi:hypothetical protein